MDEQSECHGANEKAFRFTTTAVAVAAKRRLIEMTMSSQAIRQPRKRLFFGLAALAWLLTAAAGLLLWRITAPGLGQLHAALPIASALIIGAGVAALGLGTLGMVLATLGFRPPVQVARTFAWWAINLVFRPVMLLGRLFDIERERIERSFIEISNHIVRGRHIEVFPNQLLILLPHCLQLDRCRHKITHRIENCRRCGVCPIGDLARLAEYYEVNIAVVPGGTLARKVIKSLKPRAVLAVACERDLVSGIQDVFPMPVIGVLNDRPQGPCCNTIVDLDALERGIRSLLRPQSLSPPASLSRPPRSSGQPRVDPPCLSLH